MRLGLISDTHGDEDGATPHIIEEFRRRGVMMILHAGDVEPDQAKSGAYGNNHVLCAITEEQVVDFKKGCPIKDLPGWKFTYPNDRVRDLEGGPFIYLGHKRTSKSSLREPQIAVFRDIDKIRTENHNLRWLIVGHSHRQIYHGAGLINLINPGAVEMAIGAVGGYEFSVLDTKTGEITFSRIQNPIPTKKPLTLGVISDTRDISEMDSTFWRKLAERFQEEGVSNVIHCGNIATEDIGKVLSGFTVHCNLRNLAPKDVPDNWKFIDADTHYHSISGYNFYLHPKLGYEIFEETGIQIHSFSKKLLVEWPETHFILGDSSAFPFMEEEERAMILMPGDARSSRSFAIVKLPRFEITFDSIKRDPMPPVKIR